VSGSHTNFNYERDLICNLIARTSGERLVAIVNSLLDDNVIPEPIPVREPQVGTVQIQVREPICRERFILADALATTAEVTVNGRLGWAMRIGADPEAAMAAAVLDAWINSDSASGHSGGTITQGVIDELVSIDEARRADDSALQAAILRTAIEFEELD
jgi:alpha-D-ribose 1-methylphosphonate 5-triphosphate synthase subunit PhnG